MNVKVPEQDSRERTKAYGLAIQIQNEILNKMDNFIRELRIPGRKVLLPFQKGILLSNSALRTMHTEMQRRFGIKYLLTYRLNQDVLESFFGLIRSKGGLYDCPDPIEFTYRLRKYILGKHEGTISLSSHGNVENDDTPEFREGPLTQKWFAKFKVPTVEAEEIEFKELDELAYDGLEYFAGYICRKIKDCAIDDPSLQQFTYVTHLSEGGLVQPPAEFVNILTALENIFDNWNNENANQTIKVTNNYIQNLIQLSNHVQCSLQVKKLFFRSRMYFKLRILNKALKDKKLSRKRKLNKTIL